MQFVNRTLNHQRVARVMTALKPRDHIGAFRQPIHDLAFAFVTPLRADNHHIRHIGPFSFAQVCPAPKIVVSISVRAPQ